MEDSNCTRRPAAFPAPHGFLLVSAERLEQQARTPVRMVHPEPFLVVVLHPRASPIQGWYRLVLRFPPEGLVDVVAQFRFAGGEVRWQRLPAIGRNDLMAFLRFEQPLAKIVLHISGSGRLDQPTEFQVERMRAKQWIAAISSRAIHILKRERLGVVRLISGYLRAVLRLKQPGPISMTWSSTKGAGETSYDAWIRLFDEAPERDRTLHMDRLRTLRHRPLISCLAAVENAEAQHWSGWQRGWRRSSIQTSS